MHLIISKNKKKRESFRLLAKEDFLNNSLDSNGIQEEILKPKSVESWKKRLGMWIQASISIIRGFKIGGEMVDFRGDSLSEIQTSPNLPEV